jgi:hypothetical protein
MIIEEIRWSEICMEKQLMTVWGVLEPMRHNGNQSSSKLRMASQRVVPPKWE